MKKFLSILLSAVMVLSLAACGAKEATPNGDQSNTVNEDGTRDTYVTIKVGTGHNKNSFFYTGLAEFERLWKRTPRALFRSTSLPTARSAPRARWPRA